MGRPKSYDREDVTRRAMEVFWHQGFDGASTTDLVEHMGINRYSLFAEFGSKQGLFVAALELYEGEVVGSMLAALEAEGASLSEIRALIEMFADRADGPGASWGCLICNTAVEYAHRDMEAKEIVGAYALRLRAAFAGALERGRLNGEVGPQVVIDDEAGRLATMLVGALVLTRAAVPVEVVRGAARSAIRHLSTLRTSA